MSMSMGLVRPGTRGNVPSTTAYPIGHLIRAAVPFLSASEPRCDEPKNCKSFLGKFGHWFGRGRAIANVADDEPVGSSGSWCTGSIFGKCATAK